MTTTPPLLTKREYFAALAMQSYIQCFAGNTSNLPAASVAASWSVSYANALLAKLDATAPAHAPMTYGPPPPGYYESQEGWRRAFATEDPTWTPYDGGPMPCGPSTRVQVKYRCGETGTPDRADFYLWSWTDEAYDIVAWRKA